MERDDAADAFGRGCGQRTEQQDARIADETPISMPRAEVSAWSFTAASGSERSMQSGSVRTP